MQTETQNEDLSFYSFHRENLNDLILSLAKKVTQDRNAIEEYISLGKLYRLDGQAQRAYQLHKNLLSHPKIKGKNLNRLLTELGLDAYEAGVDDYGIQFFLQSLGWWKKNQIALLGLALAYRKKGQLVKSVEYLEKVSPSDEQKQLLFDSYVQLAQEREKSSELNEAIQFTMKAKQLFPKNQNTNLELVGLYLKTKQYDQALAYAKKHLELWPQDENVLPLIEHIFFERGDYSNIELELKSWLKEGIESSPFYVLLAKVLQKKKKFEEAQEALETSLEIDPQNFKAFLKLLEIPEENQNFKAIQSLAKKLSVNSS